MVTLTRTSILALLSAAAALAAGCPKIDPPAGPDAAAVETVNAKLPDAAPPAVDAGPQPLDFKLTAVSGESSRALVRGGENDGVALNSRFKLELPPLTDVRVRLFDEADKAAPSADRSEWTDKALRYELVPSEPLSPGSRYALLIDGLRADFPCDAQGRGYELVRVELKTEGEKPKPAGAKKPGRAKKKP